MIANYLKTSLRYFKRNKLYTLLNILGLALGIAVCLVIFLIIHSEYSFDGFHTKEKRIFRVITQYKNAEGIGYGSGVPFPLAPALKLDFPQVALVAPVYATDNTQIGVDGNRPGNSQAVFKEETGVFYTTPAFFDIFNFNFVYGQPSISLKDPNSALLTKSAAAKYFGSWQASIGKTIRLNNKTDLKVTGVLADPPANTDFQFKIIVPYNSLSGGSLDDWKTSNSNTMCYLYLPSNISESSVNNSFPAFIKKYKPNETTAAYILQPLRQVHFDTDTSNFLKRTVSKSMLNTLALVAFFILIIATVNFVNLSTAQALNRSKEIGIRKVLGSEKHQIRLQFFFETGLITMCSITIALVAVHSTLPFIDKLLGENIDFNLPLPVLSLSLVSLFAIVVLLAGFYPALVLSAFKPAQVLKSAIARVSRGVNVRRTLVVVQFVIAQALIIGTFITLQQLKFLQNKPLGFAQQAIVKIPFPTDSVSLSKISSIRTQLEQFNGIKTVSFSFGAPAEKGGWFSEINYDHSPKQTDFPVNLKWADENYLNTYDIHLTAGRNLFRKDSGQEVLVNEELVRELGLQDPQEVLNKQISLWDGEIKATVVGVVNDFYSQSLHNALSPVLIAANQKYYRLANIRFQTANISGNLNHVQKLWRENFPGYVFDYKFVDETVAAFYKNEERLSNLYKLFAGIAIFLSCIGLFGLASFISIQRRKEIGIRKVLGASVRGILVLFSKGFLLQVMLSFAIACPIGWYFMNNWLANFKNRVNLSFWYFAAAGVLTAFVALATISYHAIRSSLANPVKNLTQDQKQ